MPKLINQTSKGAPSRKSAKPAEFHRFRDLPPEIRIEIWKLTLPEPRIVEIKLPHTDKQEAKNYETPVAMKVCYESREIALRAYSARFVATSYSNLGSPRAQANPFVVLSERDEAGVKIYSKMPTIYIDPKVDTLFITRKTRDNDGYELSLPQITDPDYETKCDPQCISSLLDHPSLALMRHLAVEFTLWELFLSRAYNNDRTQLKDRYANIFARARHLTTLSLVLQETPAPDRKRRLPREGKLLALHPADKLHVPRLRFLNTVPERWQHWDFLPFANPITDILEIYQQPTKQLVRRHTEDNSAAWRVVPQVRCVETYREWDDVYFYSGGGAKIYCMQDMRNAVRFGGMDYGWERERVHEAFMYFYKCGVRELVDAWAVIREHIVWS